jgi:predicted nucleic-acid-binding protein
VRIALDTNVLVRFLTWDDEHQAKQAAELIEGASAIALSTIVLCETVWVLSRAYKLPKHLIAATLREVIESRTIEVDRPAVESGLALLERGADFADGVISFDAAKARAARLITFDQTLAARADPQRVQLLGA